MKDMPKHLKNKEKRINIKKIIFLIVILLFLILGLWKNRITIKRDFSKINDEVKIEDETTIENERLVLKSKYEKNKEREIIYIFKENVLNEINIIEKYTSREDYDKEKDGYSKNKNVELIKNDDEKMMIYYKKSKLKDEEGLSYEQIYKKYMGIIGAYEVL